MTVLAVTGLKREALIAGGPGVVAIAGGSDPGSLVDKLKALHGDIQGVISFGLAGGLSPQLKVGDAVIGESVQVFRPRARDSALAAGRGSHPSEPSAGAGSRASEGRRGEIFHCDEAWRVALAAKLSDAHQGPITVSRAIVESPERKSALYAKSGALAVDMESAMAARFAQARKLPFAVLRVISDDAGHALPQAALAAMKPDGGIAVGRVVGSLLRHPLQLPALIRTGRTSNKAFRELLRCRSLCGVGFARPDL